MVDKRVTASLDKTLKGTGSLPREIDFAAYVVEEGGRQVLVDRLPQQIKKELFIDFHAARLGRAFLGELQQYCWSDINALQLYQTTLIPLLFISKKPCVLIMVRKIILQDVPQKRHSFLKETRSQLTVPQLLLSAREEEKRKIAKVLHDEVGSAAVILTSLLKVIHVQITKNQKKQALEQLQELDEQIKNCISRIKNVAVSIRPPSLEQDGALCGFLWELLENTSKYAQIPFKFECQEMKEKGVSDNVKIMLYRVVQEALNNIVKHAKAKHIFVSLKRKGDKFYLSIQDDGIGFHKKSQHSIGQMGLLAMKESVHSQGGTISVKSTVGKGTCIKVVCPCVVYED